MHSSKKRREMDMLNGSLADKILLFALPLAATGILQQLFNAADVAVVGRFVGSEAMAAVGSNAPVIGLLVNLFVGVSLGANVVISRYTGQGDERGVRKTVHTALIIAVLSGLGLALVGELIASPLLTAMGVPEEVFGMAVAYLRIYLAGMPVILLYNFESAIFRSQGDTRTPLLCLVTSGVVNVILNLFFVLVVGMTADGVALATVISNAISSMMMFVFLLRSEGAIRLDFRELHIDRNCLSQILRIGLPAGFQSMVFSIANICIQSGVNSLGADIMAASSAAFNVEILSYYVINSFGQACTTFTGQNNGAGKRDRCKKVLRLCLVMDMLFSAVIAGLLLFFGRQVLGIFNSNEVVVTYGMVRMTYILLGQPINVLLEVFSGALRGYGRSLVPAVIAVVGICGVRILWVYTRFRAVPEFRTLMQAFPLSWAVTTAVLLVYYFKVRKQLYGAARS